MARYEYNVVPSPRKGEKARSAKTTPDRFALALTTLMNRMGAEGWEYQRADTLPCDERVGLTGSKTTFQSLLVFRRVIAEGALAVPAPLSAIQPEPTFVPVLGAAEAPVGAAPSVGPVKPELAAE